MTENDGDFEQPSERLAIGDLATLLDDDARLRLLLESGMPVQQSTCNYIRSKPEVGALVGLELECEGPDGVIVLSGYVRTQSAKRTCELAEKWHHETDDRIESAARLVVAHGFITEMPDGYDTMVGERGATLSNGQRIAIARAAMRYTPVRLLDEPTTGLDAENELPSPHYTVWPRAARRSRSPTTSPSRHDLDAIGLLAGGKLKN